MQHMQQHHRIHPAGNRHQDALPRPEEPAGENALLDVVQQFAHARMLFQQPRDARRIQTICSGGNLLLPSTGSLRVLSQLSSTPA